MASQVLQDLSKIKIAVSKYEEATLIWHESYLTLLTEKGVHVFEFSHNLLQMDKKLDFIQSLIAHPKFSPTTCLFTNKLINKHLRNIEQSEMIIDHVLWPHNTQLMQEMAAIVEFKWSPNGAVNNCSPAIAVLTNVGVVEIYSQNLYKWNCVVRISELLSEEHNIHTLSPTSFQEAKDIVYMIATSALCWAPALNTDNSCYFVTAQKNGNIIFWLIDSNAIAKTIGTLQIESSEMQSLLWIPVDAGRFFLVCSNILGQILVFDCQIQNDVIELIQSFAIWEQKDRMISRFLQYVEIGENIALVCNKHRHLLVLMIDRECKRLGHYVNNINDYRITSICKTNNEIYITTVNSQIYKLNMVMESKELTMSLDSIQFQGLTPTHELYGIAFSANKILCAICVADRKVNCRKDTLKIETLIMSSQEMLDSLVDLLIQNPKKNLMNSWDVIEALKYKCLKTKQLPTLEYEQLYEIAVTDLYILKVYYILCVFCDNLRKTFKISSTFQLPENNPDIIKEEILVAHADRLLHLYSSKFKNHGKLNHSEMEYYIGAKKFLEYYFEKNKKSLQEVMDSHILIKVETMTSFTCQCCDEEVTNGFKCKNDHMNMFCALTFTPIQSDNYLICKWCNLTARAELFVEKPLCLFCDIPLQSVRQLC